MLIRFFNRGPWDGIQFEAPIELAPHAFCCRDMHAAFEPTNDPNVEVVHSLKRDHHQYFFDHRKLRDGVQLKVGENLPRDPENGEDPLDLVDEDLIVMAYRYAPGEKVWWEE